MKHGASISGKLILSGEYAVVFGYPGIAMPCSVLGTATGAVPAPLGVTATWGSPSPLPLSQWEREKKICGMTVRYSGIESEDYLHRILNEIQKHTGPCLTGRQALSGPLTIENTIPIGRGMGSSTALVIAICRCLFGSLDILPPCVTLSDFSKKNRIEGQGGSTRDDTLKECALSIEDTVNPGHSGLDFAVIWNEKPILFQKGKPPQVIDITINRLMGTFASSILIDTGKPNETTTELVAWVKNNSLSPRERAGVRGALQTITNCTSRLLAGESPFVVFPDHHRAQVALGVVPEPVQALIADIEKAGGAAKIVGAGSQTGGGGMVLALHSQPEKLLTIAKQHGMATLALTPTHPPLHFHFSPET